MKYCPKCGAATRPNQKFCGSCGAPLSSTPPQAQASWPPVQARRRKIRNIVVAVVLAVVLLAVLGVTGWFLFLRPDDTTQPAAASGESSTSLSTGIAPESDIPEERRLYLENLTAVSGMTLTIDGVAAEYYEAEDGRLYIDRDLLTQTDMLLRAIVPDASDYQTTLALVSKPSNPTASFGTMTACEADGYNQPDESYLDAMVSVYYRSQLNAFNTRQVEDLRFSTDLNDQSWTEAITMGAYDAVAYDLEQSDMNYSTQGLGYGDGKVTLNVAGHWVGTNRESGAAESGTDYMTIQAVWRDGIWQVDRCVPCTEEDYKSGTLQLSTH